MDCVALELAVVEDPVLLEVCEPGDCAVLELAVVGPAVKLSEVACPVVLELAVVTLAVELSGVVNTDAQELAAELSEVVDRVGGNSP